MSIRRALGWYWRPLRAQEGSASSYRTTSRAADFIGEGLHKVSKGLDLDDFLDTSRKVYCHYTTGLVDVTFAAGPPVLKEVGYAELPVLEVISRNADADTFDSVKRIASLGYVRA